MDAPTRPAATASAPSSKFAKVNAQPSIAPFVSDNWHLYENCIKWSRKYAVLQCNLRFKYLL